jgi:Mn2+/Fe2+ NRAMP family transporter
VVAFTLWMLLWFGNFGVIENGVSLLGLVTLAFLAGAILMGPSWGHILQGAVPRWPAHDSAQYWFLAISIIGSLLQPFMLNFYASGAVEEKWSIKDLGVNRIVATAGMTFGSVIAIGILVLGAMVLQPRGIHVDSYEQAALTLVQPFGAWGLPLFAASLGIACTGAALQVSLNMAYLVAQGLGWNWSENLKPHEDARFASVYTLAVALGSLVVIIAGDPLRLTMFSMAFNAAIAPLVVFPLLILMNDRSYIKQHPNGLVGNTLVAAIVVMACLIALVAIPLEVLGE